VRRLTSVAIAITVMHAGAFILRLFGSSTAAPDWGGEARRLHRVLAETLGLPHAFDADHVMAIDLVTRKLISNSRRRGRATWKVSLWL
jgi:high-affinity nickel permease